MISVSDNLLQPGRRLVTIFLCIGLAVAALVELEHLSGGPVVSKLNFFLYDCLVKYAGKKEVSEKIVIVDIDERSLAEIGQWPWPRYRLAQLLRAIAERQPAAIGVDILMPEPDRTSLSSISASLSRDFGIDITISGAPPELFDSDELLGKVIRSTPTVSSFYFLFDHTTEQPCEMADITVGGMQQALDLYEAPGVLCNTEKLHSENNFSGFINTLDDEDGLLRRLPMLIQHRERIYPNLALAAVMQFLEVDTLSVERDIFAVRVTLGGREMVLGADGTMLLPYPGPAGEYRYLSATELLNGTVNSAGLRNALVFLGSSAAGLYDFHHTIFDPNYPGVETLAVAAGAILRSNFIYEPTWSFAFSVILSGVTVILVCIFFVVVDKPIQAMGGIVVLLTLILGGGGAVFVVYGMSLPLGAPVITACILFALFSLARYGIERRKSFLWFQKMARSQQVTLETMATVVETRDYETGGHIKRTQHFVRVIAEQLAAAGVYREILSPEYIELLFVSAPLHDIGKVGVPDTILLKPGPLSDEEFEEMKKHTVYGRHILVNSGKRLAGDNFLGLACQIAESHHEKWDGTGYPLGLSGNGIPLSGRIMMVADVYDALTSKRCYKPAYGHEQACEILRQGRGTFFDPAVLDAFFARESDIIAISEKIRDRELALEV